MMWFLLGRMSRPPRRRSTGGQVGWAIVWLVLVGFFLFAAIQMAAGR